MRACAAHPVAGDRSPGSGSSPHSSLSSSTFGGSLKDEFEIPGSDTQRATDLIESEFASEQGGVLNLVFAAPEGERLDTPERKAAIEDADRRDPDTRVRADRGPGRHRERRRPVQRPDVLRQRPYRLRGGAVRPRHLRRGSRAGRRGAGRRARGGRAGRCHRRVQRRRRVPADRAGDAGAASACFAALIVLLVVFRTFVAAVDPDRARDRRRRDGVHPALHPRRAHRRSTRSRRCSCR